MNFNYKISFCLSVFFVFFIATCLSADEWYEVKLNKKIDRIKEDISLLNLINGISLTEEQIDKIIVVSRKAGEFKREYIKESEKFNKEYETKLSVLKSIIEKNQAIPASIEEGINKLEKQHKSINHSFYKDIKALEMQLDSILTDGQKLIIYGFNTCVIPPKDLSNPIRAGQSNSNLVELENLLSVLRNLSGDTFIMYSESIIQDLISDQEQNLGPISDEGRQKEETRLSSVLEKSREMSDVDFEINKGQLAREMVKRYYEVSDKYNEFMEFASTMHGGISKVGQYFLNPVIIPLLESHRTALRKPSYVKKSNINRIALDKKKSDNKKMAMKDFASMLRLNREQYKKSWEYIAKGKQKAFEMLIKDRNDGINMIQEIGHLETSNLHIKLKTEKMLNLLSLYIPNTKTTYYEGIKKIKSDIETELKRIFTKDQFNSYKLSKIDLLDIEEK